MSDAATTAVTGTDLPDSVVDPDWIAQAVPGTTPEQALFCGQLATLVITSATWPNTIPDPAPLPITMAALSIGCRLAMAGAGGDEATSGRVVSESLGAYSYRLANTPGVDTGWSLTSAERELLEPWLSASKVYELDTGATRLVLPWWWFQHDLDRVDDRPAELLATWPADGVNVVDAVRPMP